MPLSLPQKSCDALIAAIRDELRRGLARAEAAVYKQRVITYWHIGWHKELSGTHYLIRGK